MSERLLTALVVDAFVLIITFESAIGNSFREQNPIGSRFAVGLGILACAIGTWFYLKKPARKTEKEIREVWVVVTFFVGFFVVFGQDDMPHTSFTVFGLFLLFGLGKIAIHG
jgi:hypothetical protein